MKYLILLLIFVNTLYSYTKEDVISNIYVSLNNQEYIDIAEIEFTDRIRKFDLKLVLNKEVLENKKYYLRLTHNYKNIKDINVNAFRTDNELIIELNKDIKKEIIIKVDSKSRKNSLLLNLDIYDENEFKNILDLEKLLFGVAYGIIFCAFLYNFIFFLYNKEKSFLYYSLLQLSLLLFLLSTTRTLDIFKPIYDYISLIDLWGQLVFIFAVLFNRSFLDLKKYVPKLDKILMIIFFILIIDTFVLISGNKSLMDDYFSNSLFLGILVLSSLMVYRQGYKIALFYIHGWGIVFISVFLIEYDFLNYSDTYILHFAIPLESLILSLSLGYKMKQLEKKTTT